MRSDVFSLGILMYEMFSGSRPFGGTTTGAILVAIARDAASPGASASAGASASVSAEGLPRSSNADAQRFFEEAMRSFHDGTDQAVRLLQAAVKADPSFGGAYHVTAACTTVRRRRSRKNRTKISRNRAS